MKLWGKVSIRVSSAFLVAGSLVVVRCVGSDDSVVPDGGPDGTVDANQPDTTPPSDAQAEAETGPPCISTDAGGALDQTFNTGSKNLGAFGANAATIDSQGRIYVVGTKPTGCTNANAAAVYRFTNDGSLDNTYGAADGGGTGVVCIHYDAVDSAYAAAIDSSGRLVVGGLGYDGATYVHATVTRLNPDGTFDSAFHSNGKLDLDPKGDAGRNGFSAIQGIGFFGKKIVVTGSTDAVQTCMSCSGGNFTGYIARLTEDGQFDTGFNGSGIYKDTTVDGYYNLYVDGAGTITTVGSSLFKAAVDGGAATPKAFFVRRLDVSGQPVASFANGGTFSMPLDQNFGDDGRDIIAIGNRLLVAGSVDFLNGQSGQFGKIGVVALGSTSGALDTTWGGNDAGVPPGVFVSNPIFTMNEYYQITTLAAECDGKLLTGGTYLDPEAGANNQDLGVRRLTANGALDTTFGNGGLAHFTQNGNELAVAVVQDPTTSRIVVVGRDGTGNTVLARFLP